jgi:SAM-dependent methyltransferase
MSLRRQAERQFGTLDTLQTRIETHQRFSERQTDLDAESATAMQLAGDEAVLDIGCGPGVFLSYLREHGHRGHLAGLDQSEAMIAAARERDPAIDWIVGDATQLLVVEGEYDWVVARHVFQFIDDLEACLRAIGDLVGPDGALLAMTNSRRPWPMMWDLLQDALSAHGITTSDHMVRDFSIETAPTALGTVFGQVDEVILDNAFIFTTPEPIATYLGTLLPSIDEAREPEMRAALVTWMEREAAHRLNAMGGIWRDSKAVGLYVCRKPRTA